MKTKGLTICYILLGIISIFTLSVFLISNLTFIYNIFCQNNILDYDLEILKEAYRSIINYVVRGASLEKLNTLNYSEGSLLNLSILRDYYFDLKLIMIFSIGCFLMLYVLFSKNSIYSYEKIEKHTPYLYIGLFSLVFSFAIFVCITINNTMYVDTLSNLFLANKFELDDITNLLPGEYFVLMSYIILFLVSIISVIFIVIDYKILYKEGEHMSVKLIAIDLDGTLLNDNKEVGERTFKALKAAKDKGIYIVLASGRPIQGIIPLIHKLELDTYENYAISFNGASVYKVSDYTSIINYSMPLLDMLEINEFTSKHNMHSHVFVNGKAYIEENGEYSDLEASINHIDLNLVKYSDFDKDVIVNKFLLSDDPQKLKEFHKLIPSSMYEKYNIVFSAPFFLEFLSKDASKGNAVKALCEYLNIRSECVMAIGDEENDLSMLEYAGHKIAMGNANQKLKDIATYITDSNNDDGVGKAIEKIVLNEL